MDADRRRQLIVLSFEFLVSSGRAEKSSVKKED
jgi:hypothetical protein